jgi:hypothetical protein
MWLIGGNKANYHCSPPIREQTGVGMMFSDLFTGERVYFAHSCVPMNYTKEWEGTIIPLLYLSGFGSRSESQC